MLEERHERRGYRHDLRWRHVHVLHALWRQQHGLALLTGADQLIDQLAVLVQAGIGLGDDVLALFDGRQVVDVHRHLAVGNPAVRRFKKAVLVQLSEQGQRVDQTDVRTFRRFDRADTAIVGGVHVAHLEARTFTRQTTRAQSRDPALVRDLAQRVGLVHELRQLARPEELLQRGTDGLRIDQVMRHQGFGFCLAQTLLHGLLDARKTAAVLVLGQLTDTTHTPVAQVVDVIDVAVAIAQVDEDLDDIQDVVVAQRHLAFRRVAAHTSVEFHPADTAQVVRVLAVEQAVEQRFDGVFGGRLARAHHAVDGHSRRQLIGGFVSGQGLADERALVQLVRVQALDVLDTRRTQLLQHRFGDFFVGFGHDLARVGIDHVLADETANQEIFGHADETGAGLFELAHVARGDALVLLDNDIARLVSEIETRDFALQTLRHEFHLRARVHQTEMVVLEEMRQDRFRRQADGLQQDGHRHLAASVDAEIQDVLGVELEVEPRTAIRNDSRTEKQLAAAVRFALVVLEEHARAAVQLADDDTLGTVHDEGAVVGHQGHFAHVDLLLLDFLDQLLRMRLAVVNDHLQLRAHGRSVGQAPLLALAHIEGWLCDVVFAELHLHKTVVRDDGERGDKGRLQTLGLAF